MNNYLFLYLCLFSSFDSEMKFSEHEFAITKQYEKELENKIDAFLHSRQHTKPHSIQLVMVTTDGITENEHAKDVNQNIVLDDLF